MGNHFSDRNSSHIPARYDHEYRLYTYSQNKWVGVGPPVDHTGLCFQPTTDINKMRMVKFEPPSNRPEWKDQPINNGSMVYVSILLTAKSKYQFIKLDSHHLTLVPSQKDATPLFIFSSHPSSPIHLDTSVFFTQSTNQSSPHQAALAMTGTQPMCLVGGSGGNVLWKLDIHRFTKKDLMIMLLPFIIFIVVVVLIAIALKIYEVVKVVKATSNISKYGLEGALKRGTNTI